MLPEPSTLLLSPFSPSRRLILIMRSVFYKNFFEKNKYIFPPKGTSFFPLLPPPVNYFWGDRSKLTHLHLTFFSFLIQLNYHMRYPSFQYWGCPLLRISISYLGLILLLRLHITSRYVCFMRVRVCMQRRALTWRLCFTARSNQRWCQCYCTRSCCWCAQRYLQPYQSAYAAPTERRVW